MARSGHHGYVTDLIPEYETWADQAFACGPVGMLKVLAGQAAGRRQRLGVAKLGRKRGAGKGDAGRIGRRRDARRSCRSRWNRTWAARSGRASGCVVVAASGPPLRVCREGPVFASEELDWESSWR